MHQFFLGDDRMRVPPGTHMCLIFGDDTDRLGVVADFLATALSGGGHASYFAATTRPEDVRAAVRSRSRSHSDSHSDSHSHSHSRTGATADAALEVLPAAGVYRPAGAAFSGQAMLDRLRRTYGRHAARFNGPIHFAGEMEWALEPPAPDLAELVGYESGVNDLIVEAPFSAVCQYDARLFDADRLFEIIRVHPYLIVDGLVIANPDFQPGRPGGARRHAGRAPTAAPGRGCGCGGSSPPLSPTHGRGR